MIRGLEILQYRVTHRGNTLPMARHVVDVVKPTISRLLERPWRDRGKVRDP